MTFQSSDHAGNTSTCWNEIQSLGDRSNADLHCVGTELAKTPSGDVGIINEIKTLLARTRYVSKAEEGEIFEYRMTPCLIKSASFLSALNTWGWLRLTAGGSTGVSIHPWARNQAFGYRHSLPQKSGSSKSHWLQLLNRPSSKYPGPPEETLAAIERNSSKVQPVAGGEPLGSKQILVVIQERNTGRGG